MQVKESSTVSQKVILQNQQQKQERCQQCEFILSCKLSQDIIEMKQKISFYQTQNQQFLSFFESYQNDPIKSSSFFANTLHDQFYSQNQAQKQLKYLEQQLRQIEQELENEVTSEKQYQHRLKQICQQFESLKNQNFELQSHYNQLLEYDSFLNYKQAELTSLESLFHKTNFINIIYSITFQDDSSFINGQKITPENSWKIVQIIAFYHQKYQSYRPHIQIKWELMQITQLQVQAQEINSGCQMKAHQIKKYNPLQIYCENEKTILQSWMPLILLQIKNFFKFIVEKSSLPSRLKFQITEKGQFDHLKEIEQNRIGKKFNSIVKCLLINIDQINKLEFFAKQRNLHNFEFYIMN